MNNNTKSKDMETRAIGVGVVTMVVTLAYALVSNMTMV